MTVKLLEHNKVYRHPWLTPQVVAEEVAIKQYADNVVEVALDSIGEHGHQIYYSRDDTEDR